MKILILIIAAVAISYTTVFSQGCLPEGIRFQSQFQVDSFQFYYPGCTVIEGDVFINGGVYNLYGLSLLTSIGGYLVIDCVPLSDLTGLDALTSIGGALGIFNTGLVDMTGLGSLDSIGGNLSFGCLSNSDIICNNLYLNNMHGLESLTHIGRHLNILGNGSLSNLYALSGLTSVGGIDIRSNSSLTSLAGLDNINPNSIISLTIAGNASLSSCNVQGICNYLVSPGGEVNIYSNAAGCANPAEVAGNCGISLPCLPYGNYYFYSQSDIDSYQSSFSGCTELQGNVSIRGGDISNLSGLLDIHSVNGFCRFVTPIV
ncbi:MAG: hypothetical protein ACOYMF_16265 [Bacteroidales bacterium]